jgi:hypothetical protein
MTSSSNGRVLLVDSPDGPVRTTATLVASLAARLATLHMVSGADAVGSLTAGFAALGREVSRSAEGARVRRALEKGRASTNGNALWSTLRIGEWASGLPAGPVLQQLRNDVALLLADDLEDALEVLPIPSEPAGAEGKGSSEPATFLDCVMGLWAFSAELVRSVEALAAPTLGPRGFVAAAEGPSHEAESSLLR